MICSKHLYRNIRATIGNNIRRSRLKKDMPLRKLTRLTDIPEWQLDYYELGRSEITLHHMIRIACALGMRFEELMQ